MGVSNEQNQHPNEGNRLDRKLESSLFPYYLSVWHHFSNSCVRLGFGAYRSLLLSPLASQKPIWGGALLLAIAPFSSKRDGVKKKRERGIVGRMKENEKNTRECTTQTVCSTLRSPMLRPDSYLDADADVSSLGSPLDLGGLADYSLKPKGGRDNDEGGLISPEKRGCEI